jgi:hypothetical protein
MHLPLLNNLKLILKSNYFIFKLLRYPLTWSGYFKRRGQAPIEEFWKDRINIVLDAPDNKNISRVQNAGQIIRDIQVMHNGILIHVGSYYGDGNTILLLKNKGVHEPQEERAFEEILNFIPTGATMLELGSFWAFYSLSFLQKVKHGKSYLIEPDMHALVSGKNNFRLNNLKGSFFNYYISDHEVVGKIPAITVDAFLLKAGITHLNILHSDIQGLELKMLLGATQSLKGQLIDYFFISTHSNDLHESCKSILREFDYLILCDANLDETYSWDGLIVAKHRSVNGPSLLEINKRGC